MNDPNGMVYDKGIYHLFYQYYPDSTVWGPMHWGHASSADLIHWKNLPVALYPDSLGYIFSGSAVVDKKNSSGFQQGSIQPLVAVFTYHNIAGEKKGRNDFQYQGLAYSIDHGKTWQKYAGNPIIANPGIKDFRDPKLIWHEGSGKWIITLAAGNKVQFYASADLKKWQLCGTFGEKEGSHDGVWECPDLFPLKTADGKETKWVLLVSVGTGAPNGGSGTQYFTGEFDGQKFVSDAAKTVKWIDYGTDNYAGITWSNSPDNRRIFLGWMSNWQYAQQVPTKNWRSAMTIPRELGLLKSPAGYHLIANPVKETLGLRLEKEAVNFLSRKEHPISLNELLLNFSLENPESEDFGIELFNSINEKLRIGYNRKKNSYYIDRTHAGNTGFSKEFAALHEAPRLSNHKTIQLHLFIDKSSVELFADGGKTVMTDLFFPTDDFNAVRAYSKSGTAPLINGSLYELKSIWK
jgi:fructan beta-fructosidase